MFNSVLTKYNPKDNNSHGILKFFAENLTESESVNFIQSIFDNGSWILPTEISRSFHSSTLKEKTTNEFNRIFDKWVSDRIEFSEKIPARTKNPYITENLHFEFREALLSVKNLNFPNNIMGVFDRFFVECKSIYLSKFFDGCFWVVIEDYDEKEIELFFTYFSKKYIYTQSSNYDTFLYRFLNSLAFSHKIFNLSIDFINQLRELSNTLKGSNYQNNYQLLISILLIDLIENKKLDLSDSVYNSLVENTLNCLLKGNYDNLDFFIFLKRFNYTFINFDVVLETNALFQNLQEALSRLQKIPDIEKQGTLHHFINSSNEYFELFLFYQELSTESKAIEDFYHFINLIDEIRTTFSSMLWYEEFLNIEPIEGKIVSFTKGGFEVKIDEEFFKSKLLEKEIDPLVSRDFISHFGFGFLHSNSLYGFPKAKALFNSFNKPCRAKTVIESKDIELIEDIRTFYISNLNYSVSNKGNLLVLTPYKESNSKIINRFKLKAFFSSIEFFLIEKANNFLKFPSPFSTESNSFRLTIPPHFIDNYKIQFSELSFWEVLKNIRPFLYETIYLKNKETEESLERVRNAFSENTTVIGLIKSKAKGGMIVDVFGLDAFLPGSHIEVHKVLDYDEYIGKTMDFKVIKINEGVNFVISHKAIINVEYEKLKKEFLANIFRGQIVEGIVKNFTTYGVFVDLGGVDGLIHITELSWGRVSHPEEILSLGQKIKVIIIDFDDEKKRIELAYKQLSVNPWDTLSNDFKVGSKVKGKVVLITEYGAFIKITSAIEGLIHVSEMSWSQHFHLTQDFMKVGDEVEAIVLTINREERKISLGIKQLKLDPWENIKHRFAIGSKHIAKVVNFTSFGIFVELEEGVDGLIHISDLSWSVKVKHPSEFTQIGAEINVQVLEIDSENRRLNLGHKQLKKKALSFNKIEFKENSIYKGTVKKLQENGAIISLSNGRKAFCPKRHLIKVDRSKVIVGESMDFKVIEVNSTSKKIIVSHASIYDPFVKNHKKKSTPS